MRTNKSNHTAILKHLRQDARKSFSTISRESGIPVTTVFDNYQKLERDGIIKKHASLMDFRKLGFFYRSFVFVKLREHEKFLSFINSHPGVNSVFRIDGYDFLIDTVFPSIKEFYNFLDQVRDFDIEKLECHDVIEHIKKEEFLS
ncbi:Lrp/AsnC family transcriptional regulator [Candidatus Woesearchaeota archaeon]|nr:Lrp/AsnC family transcriptional regulator [Candidatus Woesearchaeota archaeon]